MIFRITYLSGPYRVKAYLGLPRGLVMAPERLQAHIADLNNLPREALPVELTASQYSGRPAGCLADRPAAASPGADSAPLSGEAAPPGVRPVLAFLRGGYGPYGRVRPHWVDGFAARGFVVIAPCYRGNEGGEGRDEFGGADREDVAAAIRLVRALPFCDPGPVAVAGFSRGAINAARAAADMPEAVRRLVLWSGVADLARTYEERPDLRRLLKRLLGGSPARRPKAYRERSPLGLAERLRCPTLIVHGAKDEQVSAVHGLAMYEKMKQLGLPAELWHYEALGHHFPYREHEALLDRMAEWLRRPDESSGG